MAHPEPVGNAHFSEDEFAASVAAVTTAFGDHTRREIYLAVREAPHTANEIANQFGLHPNVARHHLEKLVAGGYVTTSLATPTGAGRPSKVFRASDTSPAAGVPARRDNLLSALLQQALALLPTEQAAEMAEQVGFEYGRQLVAEMSDSDADEFRKGQKSLRSAVATVAEALTAHGFAAHSEQKGRRLTIVNQSCPFGPAATEFPDVMCAVDQGMIRGMMFELYGDRHPEFLARVSDGDNECRASV